MEEIGEQGQARLLRARVAVVGAGGLGSSVLYYLAAAGVGSLRIIDADTVELGNLQRQILHSEEDLGRPKISSATEKLRALNPLLDIDERCEALHSDNAEELLQECDIVVDGADNYVVKSTLNVACARLGVPLVGAAASRFEGELWHVDFPAIARGEQHGGCYQCMFPTEPRYEALSRCDQIGVVGPLVGVLGCMQAHEVLLALLGLESALVGKLLLVDLRELRFHRINAKPNPQCPVCAPLVRAATARQNPQQNQDT